MSGVYWLSGEEKAKHPGVGRETIFNLIEEHLMPAIKCVRCRFFRHQKVSEWIKQSGKAVE